MSEEGEEIPQGKVGMENNSYASTASGTSVISQTLVIIIIMSMVYGYHH